MSDTNSFDHVTGIEDHCTPALDPMEDNVAHILIKNARYLKLALETIFKCLRIICIIDNFLIIILYDPACIYMCIRIKIRQVSCQIIREKF